MNKDELWERLCVLSDDLKRLLILVNAGMDDGPGREPIQEELRAAIAHISRAQSYT
jgi:hypothetical protein